MASTLEMREISTGVAEVYAGELQIGMITWSINGYSGIVSQWYATYANGDETLACSSREDALEMLRVQHAVVQRLARSIRSIRPASESHRLNTSLREWDRGYNSSLRAVERLLQEVVGQAPEGEGYTAITRNN